jgi:hypothetical protein
MSLDRVDAYHEALEFFYLEPQHLRTKTKNTAGERSLRTVTRRLRRLEVTLNHNINQFLLLAPVAFRARLFHKLFNDVFDHPFEMHGRNVDDDLGLQNSVQPDFLFLSDREVISIEMKIEAKSSLDQVLKYASLGLAAEMRDGLARKHHLGFFGVGNFSNLWRAKFPSTTELKCALTKQDLFAFLKKRPQRFRSQQGRFNEIVQQIALSFLSYRDLAEFLKTELPASPDAGQATEVYRNLISGLLSEFDRRQLTR